ncbi:MAG: hypothetical protein WCW30_00955 [Candidatus Gracilibacteria bacterium]|jgi:hypothetical protein
MEELDSPENRISEKMDSLIRLFQTQNPEAENFFFRLENPEPGKPLEGYLDGAPSVLRLFFDFLSTCGSIGSLRLEVTSQSIHRTYFNLYEDRGQKSVVSWTSQARSTQEDSVRGLNRYVHEARGALCTHLRRPG